MRFKIGFALGLLVVASDSKPALATFHEIKVKEVFAGSAAHPTAQYVMIQAYAGGQNFLTGHSVLTFDATGASTGTFTFPATVSNGANQMTVLVATADRTFGPIDLFCSNAGIGSLGGLDADDEVWQRSLETNLLAHVYAVRAVLPSMLDRGEGYLLHTASAAGLLTQLGDLPYSVTKHASVSVAEWTPTRPPPDSM